jgi:hypothetical protein
VNYKDLLSRYRNLLIGLPLLLAFSTITDAQQVPVAPATSNGNYNVSYVFEQDSQFTWLSERTGPNGAWAYNNFNSVVHVGNNVMNATFTNKPAGEYFYRVEVLYTNEYGESWYSWSEETRVVVTSGGPQTPPPTQDLVSNQVRYTYAVRIGDINADGRQDVFVNRTAGGVALNGTLGSVILQQQADKTFLPTVPTAGMVSTASNWPASNTPLELDDINFDGYVDIRLPNLGSVISGVFGQIIFSPGQVNVAAPQKVTAINAKVTKFLNDTQLWLEEPHYFTNNASIIGVPVYVQQMYCDYVWYGDYYNYECWYEWVFLGYQYYYDFSPWDIDAVRMRYSFSPNTSGDPVPAVVPGSTEAGDINRWFRTVFGVDLARGILTVGIGNCTSTNAFAYDSDVSIPCVEIGVPLLQSIHTPPSNCRSLTYGEKEMTALERVHIFNVDAVKICHKAYMWKWIPPNLKSDVMAPDGNIYVRPNSSFAWREDYSYYSTTSNSIEYAVIQHELVHVFQTRNGGCEKYCMLAQRMKHPGGSAYIYWPLTPGMAFNQYNIEQQGQMVQDRFRMQPSIGLGPTPTSQQPGNLGADYNTLNSFIPTLQGFMKLH